MISGSDTNNANRGGHTHIDCWLVAQVYRPYDLAWVVIGSNAELLVLFSLRFWCLYPHSHIIINGKERKTSFLPTVSRVVLNLSPKVNLPSLAHQFNNSVFCWQGQSPVQLQERSKIILETNPTKKTTKKYP